MSEWQVAMVRRHRRATVTDQPLLPFIRSACHVMVRRHRRATVTDRPLEM